MRQFLVWSASTEPALRPFEFEQLTRAVFDVTAVSATIARAYYSRHIDPDWPAVSDSYRDERNDRIRVANLSYSNPFILDVETIDMLQKTLIAAAAIGGLLVTGTALRRKYMAEARKTDAEAGTATANTYKTQAEASKTQAEAAVAEATARKLNAEAARLEYDLEMIARADLQAAAEPSRTALPPEADGTWEDVTQVLDGGDRETDLDRMIGQFARNAGINRQLMVMRRYRFDVHPREERDSSSGAS